MDTNGLGEQEEPVRVLVPTDDVWADVDGIVCPFCDVRTVPAEAWVDQTVKWTPIPVECPNCGKSHSLEIQVTHTFVTRLPVGQERLVEVWL